MPKLPQKKEHDGKLENTEWPAECPDSIELA